MFTLISLILIIGIILIFFLFKRNLIHKIIYKYFYLKNKINKRKNDLYKSNINNQVRFHEDNNIYTNLEKYYLKKQMVQLFKGSKEEKLEALNIARKLSDKSTLNVLRIGLKDMDSDIVKLSAEIISKFK